MPQELVTSPAIHYPCIALFIKLINDCQEDLLLSTVNVQEKVSGCHILHIGHILHFMSYSTYLTYLNVRKNPQAGFFKSKELKDSHDLCVKHLCLPHLRQSLFGEKGTIPLDMQREPADFPGASWDKSQYSGDGGRWW